MKDGITLYVLGDSGPFSRMGKSIGYRVTIGKSSYLVDCGAPLFQQIGGHGLKEISGLTVTHCHDDHKRWFTDLALFNMYAADFTNRVSLLTSEAIHDDLVATSAAALDRSLTRDSSKVIDIAYEDYIDYEIVGPRARYRITSVEEGNGKTGLYVIDTAGNVAGSEKAKIVISNKTRRPRLLFRDPDSKEWIEPENYYPFSSNVFYGEDKNIYRDKEGFTIEAIKAPVWHGVPAVGFKFSTDKETLVFSSDTVNDLDLWKRLYTKKRKQTPGMSKKEFEAASVIYGDINDYIERVWSKERYDQAIHAYDSAIVIHDISVNAGAVHTDYRGLKNSTLKQNRTILTHGPDKITSEWVLCNSEKNFRIKGNKFFEKVDDRLYPLNADVYHKDAGKYYVGYKNERGLYTVNDNEGLLDLSREGAAGPGRPLFKVDLYEVIAGRFYPKLEDENSSYRTRKDGRVELVESTEEGSRGRIVEDYRDRLLKK
ncbi:MAG TPA: hypothetical protein ENG95_03170 [Nitrospirae bacterium]|nr:ribonuclease BN [bacterium BMS3Abin10]GBE37913.1 ribonuclease BN [bacterium BMS3Bbin08]HDO25633.1 hypothetical protein [Nitrospirota bacterium]